MVHRAVWHTTRGRNSTQWDCVSANSRLPQDKINLLYGHEELIFNEILLGRNIILGGFAGFLLASGAKL